MFSHNLHKNTLKDIWFARSSQDGIQLKWCFFQVFVHLWEFPFGSGQDRHKSCHWEQSNIAFPCESSAIVTRRNVSLKRSPWGFSSVWQLRFWTGACQSKHSPAGPADSHTHTHPGVTAISFHICINKLCEGRKCGTSSRLINMKLFHSWQGSGTFQFQEIF